MGLTYKQAWLRRIIMHLRVYGQAKRCLSEDLKKMTGHGLAHLSSAIDERLEET